MKHLNVQKGIKLIYISMVLLVGNEIFEFLESLMESELLSQPMAGSIFKVIANVLLLAGVMMQIVGLGIARKDDVGYDRAFRIGIGGFGFVIAVSMVQGVLETVYAMDVTVILNLTQLVYSALSLAVDYLTIKTTIQLLERNDFQEQATMGEKIWRTIFALFLTAMILGLIAGSFLSITDYYEFSNANILANRICILLEVVIGILEIIAYAKFRKYLKHVYLNL